MTTFAWWDRLESPDRDWLIANNGDAVPAAIAERIRVAGGEATVGEPLPDDAVDWIEAVANGESAR